VDPQPAVESDIARDIARHGLIVAPIVVALAAVLRGANGATSAAIGLALVVVNFLGAAALQGYVLRLALMVVAILLLKRVDGIDLETLVITGALAHVALLFWELRSVRLSLAEPGLKVARPQPVPHTLPVAGKE
jgi:hypothetical protein